MGFSRNRAERHRAGSKTLDDFFGWLNFIQRDRLAWIDLEFKQTAQGHVTLGLIVDQLGVLFIAVEVVGTGRVLQLGDRVRCPHVFFAADTVCIFAAGVERVGQYRIVAERSAMQAQGFFRHFKYADTFNIR